MRLRRCLVPALLLALAGCGSSDTASFLIDGNQTALTLERTKPYAWSEGWELDLTVRRNPECQRRHRLKVAATDALKVELFTPEPYVFIVRQGKRWYVTELKSCQLQAFKEAPPAPGKPVGAFQMTNGKFVFVVDPQAGPGTVPPPAAP
jgi:hypothetical protein